MSLLLVYTDKGSELGEADFNKWYDEEHIPQRLRFPGCSKASRYRAINSKHPPWAALYHTDSPGIPESPEWVALNAQASDNEKSILRKIPIVTRSIYNVSHRIHAENTPGSTSAGKVICIVHIQVAGNPDAPSNVKTDLEAGFSQWYQDFIIKGISTTPGWVRSTMYTRYSGSDMRTTPELKVAMDCALLVIHEWNEDGDAMDISKLEANITAQIEIWETDYLCKVMRATRIFSLHKEW